MISKAEREKDKAICEAATKGVWLTFGGETPGERVRIKHLDKQSGYLTIAEVLGWDRIPENAAAIVNAVNRLPAYIADAEEMERRIAKIETLAPLRAGTLRDEGATLDMVLRLLRGEP